MKKMCFMLMSMLSLSAFAGSYQCHITVSNETKVIGEIEIDQRFGTTAGTIYITEVSKKYNIFGKLREEVNLVTSGIVQYDNTVEGSFLDGEIALQTLKYGSRGGKTSVKLATLQGNGPFEINESASGYTIVGSCEMK